MPPAARVTDLHLCPTAEGPVITGELTVLVGDALAARVTDVAVCGTKVDPIETGEPSVLIGYRDAARIGDLMASGGKIITGCQTVLIGPPDEKGPCDVQTLTVVATVLGDKPKVRTLTANGRLRRTEPDGVSAEVKRMLKEHDIVIDVVADYPTEKDADPKEKMEIKASSTYYGQCTVSQHPRITLDPRTEIEELAEAYTLMAPELPKREFYASSSQWDWNNYGGGLGVVIQLVALMWPTSNTRELGVVVPGCGVREDGCVPNIELKGLVRVFRKDKWSIELKFPPMMSGTRERAWKLDKGVSSTESTRADRSWFNRTASGSTYEKGSDGGVSTRGGNQWKKEKGKATGSEFEWRSDGSAPKQEKGEEPWTPQGDGFSRAYEPEVEGITLKITHNDQELEVLSAIKKVLKGIESVKKILEEYRKLLTQLPQIGGKVTFDYKFLEGTLSGAWEPEMVGEVVAGRYLPVRTKFTFEIDILLIELAVEGSFGLDVKAGFGTKLVCKVSLELKFKLPFKVSIPDPVKEFSMKLTPELTGKVEGRLEVELLGWSLIDAKASVEAGFSAELTFSVDPKPELSGNITRKAVVFKAHYKAAWGRARSYTKEFWPDKVMMSFPDKKEGE